MTAFIPLLLLASIVMATPEPAAVQQQLKQSITNAARIGQTNNSWQQQRSRMVSDIQNLQLQIEWAQVQLDKKKRWIAKEEQNMQTLLTSLQQAQTTRDNLEPLLEKLYTDLEHHVRQDLPFHQQARSRRLSFLRTTFDDPQSTLSDKMRHLLDALQVEVSYGYTVDVSEEIAEENGRREQATVFRLGRLALFRLLGNGTRPQRFNRRTGHWEELPPSSLQEIEHGIDIARKKRVTKLLELPIGTLKSLQDNNAGGPQ